MTLVHLRRTAATLLALPALIRTHFPHTIIQTAINPDAALNWIHNFRYDLSFSISGYPALMD